MKPAWRKSQQRAMKTEGAKEQPGGGSRPGFPADGSKEGWLIEHKYTRAAFFDLRIADLTKIALLAGRRGQRPAFTFSFGGASVWRLVPDATYQQVPSLIVPNRSVWRFGARVFRTLPRAEAQARTGYVLDFTEARPRRWILRLT